MGSCTAWTLIVRGRQQVRQLTVAANVVYRKKKEQGSKSKTESDLEKQIQDVLSRLDQPFICVDSWTASPILGPKK